VRGPDSFASFDEILARTIEHNPGRSESSLRRGVVHNALEREDGRWVWRYDMHRGDGKVDMVRLGDDVATIRVPILLLRGDRSPVVDDADVEEFRAPPTPRCGTSSSPVPCTRYRAISRSYWPVCSTVSSLATLS